MVIIAVPPVARQARRGSRCQVEDDIIKSSLATTFAAAAAVLGFVALSISPARAAEIKLLRPVSLRIVLPGLVP